MAEDEGKMSFIEHLAELRNRLIRAVIAIIIGFAVCIAFQKQLYEIVTGPIAKLLPKDSTLIFTRLQDPFFIYLKVAFVAAVFLTLPYVVYQLWLFVKPGLYERERKLAFPFIAFAVLLFYSGGAFAYFVVFPAVFKFFLGFQTDFLRPMLSIKEYVSLVVLLMLAFGAVFETPIIIVFLGMLGVVHSPTLKKGRRYFIVLAFVIAAALTPPDIVSQIVMALPLLVFYEVGIQLLVHFEKKREKEDELEQQTLDGMD